MVICVANRFVCVMKLLDISRKAMKDGGLEEGGVRVAFTFSSLVFFSCLRFPFCSCFFLFSSNRMELRNLPEVVYVKVLSFGPPQHVADCTGA